VSSISGDPAVAEFRRIAYTGGFNPNSAPRLAGADQAIW